jgi:hypothetical protein
MTRQQTEYFQQLIDQCNLLFGAGDVMVIESHHMIKFKYHDTSNLHFWKLEWDLTKNDLYIPFRNITVNTHVINLPNHTARELSDTSAEYAVMFKLGQGNG